MLAERRFIISDYVDKAAQFYTIDHIMRIEEKKHLVQQIKKIVFSGTHQVLGDTYGVKTLVLPSLLNLINHDTEHNAAYGSAFTLLDLVAITGVSATFQMPSRMSVLLSRLRTTQDEAEKESIKKQIITLLHNAFVYDVAISSLMLPLIFSKSLLVGVFGQNEQVAEIAQSFLRPYSLFLFPTAVTFTLNGMIIGTGNTKIFLANSALLITLMGASIYFILSQKDASFNDKLHTLLGFCIAESYANALINFIYILFHPDFAALDFPKKFFSAFSFEKNAFKEFLWYGFKSTFRVSCDFFFPFILTSYCAHLSKYQKESQAAFALAYQPQRFNTLINCFFSIAAASAFCEAQNNKTISSDLFKKIAVAGLIITAAISSILPITFTLFPRLPATILGNHDEVVLNTLDKISMPIALATWLDSFCFALMFQAQFGWDNYTVGCIARFTGLIAAVAVASYAFLKDADAQGLAWSLPVAMIPALLILGKNCFDGTNRITAEKKEQNHHWDFYKIPNERDEQGDKAVLELQANPANLS